MWLTCTTRTCASLCCLWAEAVSFVHLNFTWTQIRARLCVCVCVYVNAERFWDSTQTWMEWQLISGKFRHLFDCRILIEMKAGPTKGRERQPPAVKCLELFFFVNSKLEDKHEFCSILNRGRLLRKKIPLFHLFCMDCGRNICIRRMKN